MVPYPGFGLGALDPFHGYVVYRLLDEDELAAEIRDMQGLVERRYEDLDVTQDLGLGMVLWMSHFFPGATWARVLRERALATLDRMWIDPPGYFCRDPSPSRREVRVHELRGVDRAAGGRGPSGAGACAAALLRAPTARTTSTTATRSRT